MAIEFNDTERAQISRVVCGHTDYDDLPSGLQDKLMEFFMPSMPYGTAKARTGDPIEFIIEHLFEAIQ